MTIFAVEGDFGVGKTSTAVYLAKKLSRKHKGCLIVSNIKLDEYTFPNYIYFEDDKFANVLRSINALNDIERELHTFKIENNSILKYYRKKFTKCFLLLDESGAIMNNRDYKSEEKTLPEYINQNRKMFTDIYCITADGEQNAKSLRRYIERYLQPSMINFPFLKDFGIVHKIRKDKEGNIAMKSYLAKDEKGDYVTKQKPEKYFFDIYFKPFVRGIYEDLHKNIRDVNKYKYIDINSFKKMIGGKKELIEQVEKNPKFKTLSKLTE